MMIVALEQPKIRHHRIAMQGRFLVRMSDADFASLRDTVIPRSVRRRVPSLESGEAMLWIFSGYCQRLLYANQALNDMCQRLSSDVTRDECWRCLTKGQRVLYCLGVLDGEVENGGITQFLWNHPELIQKTGESLLSIGETALAGAYDTAVKTLIAKPAWIELRRQFNADSMDLQPFQSSNALLDLVLGWFDDAYFHQYRGALHTRVIQYVEDNKHEFIEP